MIRSKLSMSVYKFPVKKILERLGFAETDDIVKVDFDGNEVVFLIKSDVTEEMKNGNSKNK